jgi:hypothetical protein
MTINLKTAKALGLTIPPVVITCGESDQVMKENQAALQD